MLDISIRANWPLENVDEPLENDVMCGRGAGTNYHPGNKRYRQMVEDRKMRYAESLRLEKPLVALEIIQMWRAQSPPGRFLKYDKGTGKWDDVGDHEARKKTSQALREKPKEEYIYGSKYGTTQSSEGNQKQRDKTEKASLRRGHTLGSEAPDDRDCDFSNFSWVTSFENEEIKDNLESVAVPPLERGSSLGSVGSMGSVGAFLRDYLFRSNNCSIDNAIWGISPSIGHVVVLPLRESNVGLVGSSFKDVSINNEPGTFSVAQTIPPQGTESQHEHLPCTVNIKRNISNKIESTATGIKRRAFNRDQSATSNRLKQMVNILHMESFGFDVSKPKRSDISRKPATLDYTEQDVALCDPSEQWLSPLTTTDEFDYSNLFRHLF